MRISLRLQKLGYTTAAAACLAATVAVVAWGVRSPSAPLAADSTPEASKRSAAPTIVESSRRPSRDDFAQLWDLPLRRPLYNPPPPKPEIKQLPPLRVELLGTILEDVHSMAIIRSDQGKTEYKRTGDSIGPVDCPAQLVEIHADAIVLERADERVTVKVRAQERR